MILQGPFTKSARLVTTFPNYEGAPSLTDVDASSLTEETFHRDFVDRMRPCVVRNAARHWPAFARWRDPAYLSSKLGNPTVSVMMAPMIEFYPKGYSYAQIAAAYDSRIQTFSFDEFVKLVGEGKHDNIAFQGGVSASLARERVECAGGEGPLRPLVDDILGFPFVGDKRPPRAYPRTRVFLYGRSYTDWHYHPTDETLMCQVLGAKEVLLLPPDRTTFETLMEIIPAAGGSYNIDLARFPKAAALRPYRVVVEPGDALYIPTFWWHVVESIDDASHPLGATVAWCWQTPFKLFDVRIPGVRRSLAQMLLSPYAPLAIAAAISSLARFNRPPYSA